jgi:hypothetical protein
MVSEDNRWIIIGHSFFKSICVGNDALISEARPLVVIDPEDDEQVGRLLKVWYEIDATIHYSDERIIATREALREFADPTPTEPDEPTKCYAIVIDHDGAEWVRIAAGSGYGRVWARLGGNELAKWAELCAVRVLSEGVPT